MGRTCFYMFLLTLTFSHTLLQKVTKGMEIVKKIEAYGSEMGKPREKIEITNSGAL